MRLAIAFLPLESSEEYLTGIFDEVAMLLLGDNIGAYSEPILANSTYLAIFIQIDFLF